MLTKMSTCIDPGNQGAFCEKRIDSPTSATKNLLSPITFSELKEQSTVIVAFCNFNFRSIGIKWYHRMTRLGYSNHILVATDQQFADFLGQQPGFRYQVWLHVPLSDGNKAKYKQKRDHAYLESLMAVRWKFLLACLKEGIHVVLTDVDNIFSRYVSVEEKLMKSDETIDVWHAYATKFPRKAFGRLGFVVCSGMSLWKASSGSIRFAQIMRDTCGDMCDDQRTLNNLLTSEKLNMTWYWSEDATSSRITNQTTDDPRFLGLPTLGITGRSAVTGHMAKIWDRDFAYRGMVQPVSCPKTNWVSMPILEAKSRQSAWKTKLESFDIWDEHCPSALRSTT